MTVVREKRKYVRRKVSVDNDYLEVMDLMDKHKGINEEFLTELKEMRDKKFAAQEMSSEEKTRRIKAAMKHKEQSLQEKQ